MNVFDEERSTEASFDKDNGTIFDKIDVCSYSFGSRQVKAWDKEQYICATNIMEDSYYWMRDAKTRNSQPENVEYLGTSLLLTKC